MVNVTITESAQVYLAGLLEKQNCEGIGIRMFISDPGTPKAETCIAYSRPGEHNEEDVIIEYDKFNAYFELRSIPFLDDAKVDFAEDKFGGQLTIRAPNSRVPNVSDDSLFANQLFVASTDLVIDANQLEAELSSSLARHRSQTQNAPHEFHFIAVQLSKGEDTLQAQTLLQTWIQENGLLWKVGDWQQAAGFVAAMASSIGWILNGAMVLIGVIAIIIIMNTLVISVTERLTEIGTMRAIGAQKSLVRRLIILETLVLSVSASVVGVIIGALTIGLLHWLGLNPPGDFFALLLGGQALHPTLAIQETFNAVLMMVLAALIASYYPLTIALKVNPVVAMEG